MLRTTTSVADFGTDKWIGVDFEDHRLPRSQTIQANLRAEAKAKNDKKAK
jgi:hypothetical protein